MKTKLTRDMLKVGLRVTYTDEDDGTIYNGTVEECDDLHNVWITYDIGGGGLYCFVEGCEENSEEFHPLYLAE